MKKEIIDKMLSDFEAHVESNSFSATVQLNYKLTVATIYANFETKE